MISGSYLTFVKSDIDIGFCIHEEHSYVSGFLESDRALNLIDKIQQYTDLSVVAIWARKIV